MKHINIRTLLPSVLLAGLIFLLSSQLSVMPPLGKLLNPFGGLLQNESDQRLDRTFTLSHSGVAASVRVFFDKRKVPHIYAENDADLYFAQGYVTAAMRLWQMDFISYLSAGRLSEIFSNGFLDHDRNQRRIGMLEAAKASLNMIMQDTVTARALTAYTAGVNAYIRTLSYKDLPLEYKLLNYEPEPWSELKTALVMKYMGNTLSGYEEDYLMTHMRLAIGEEKFNLLFPDFNKHSSPVTYSTAPGQAAPVSVAAAPDYLDSSFLLAGVAPPVNRHNPRLGSNSWAVSGKKTVSGAPLLCSDPHLNLSLPAVWLEMQLTTPHMNAYGVSIPGTPAVIIGFNENIAWGVANGCDDVKDWYKLKFSPDHQQYELDGKYLALEKRVEEIKRRGQAPFYDTVYYTVHGPVPYNSSFTGANAALAWHALKWELHRPSNEFLCFIMLNKATDYNTYREAISHYASPIQSFTFACKDNTIAVTHQGHMAVKWPEQGRFILDGSKSAHLSTAYIPQDSLPHLLNPPCNYVIAANQHPTDSNYPYYYNGYFRENRANRIRQLLEAGNGFDLQSMENMQLDNQNAFALEALPVLFTQIDSTRLPGGVPNMLDSLGAWAGAYKLNDKNALLFELWWKNIKTFTWDEFSDVAFGKILPDDYLLLDLIRNDPGNIYFDKQHTVEKEKAGDIVQMAFLSAVETYNKRKSKEGVGWGEVNRVNVMYMGNLDAFSRRGIPGAGNPEVINALSDSWGPSWRMVVELGKRPRAFGIYAGGQSGDPGSRYFDNFVDDWSKGKFYPLTFFISEKEAREGTDNSWTLK
ncbi:penicillin acylase family protein [Chitinophaga flava]|uniref:Penicillin acylase family protein n=1 Tax=Chitinophaga flava TaxID=2259036 RepID=A0A365XVX0_9BACT|nr:penicillin acylase family protein [Chitinophaga flava]RBL90512.1 penicillin acylase family protein [Chitinophaga flava]